MQIPEYNFEYIDSVDSTLYLDVLQNQSRSLKGLHYGLCGLNDRSVARTFMLELYRGRGHMTKVVINSDNS